MANNILQLSSTLAERRIQQLFREMESEESIFRNAVMTVSSAIEDIKAEETAVSRRIREQSFNRANNISNMSKTEAALVDQKYRDKVRQLNSRTNGNNIIRDNCQWAFPNYRHVSKDYLWMQNLALQ